MNGAQQSKAYGEQGNPAYRTLAEQGIRNAALEEAAKVCEAALAYDEHVPRWTFATAIRALKT